MRPGLSTAHPHRASPIWRATESPTTSTRTRSSDGGGSNPCSVHGLVDGANAPASAGRVLTHNNPTRIRTTAVAPAAVPLIAEIGRSSSGNRRRMTGCSTR